MNKRPADRQGFWDTYAELLEVVPQVCVGDDSPWLLLLGLLFLLVLLIALPVHWLRRR